MTPTWPPSRPSSRKPGSASSKTRSASCSEASRTRSGPGCADVNVAARAETPRCYEPLATVVERQRSRCELFRSDESDHDQLPRWNRPSQRLGQREQRVDVPIVHGDHDRPLGPRLGFSGVSREVEAGGSSARSWRRIAFSSSWSAGPGSMPSSSTSVRVRLLVGDERLCLPAGRGRARASAGRAAARAADAR